MAQANKVCPHCKAVGHSGFYCPKKPRKPIQSVSKKPKTKKAAVKRVKVKSRSQLVRELDSVFSIYIRQKDAINGIAKCVTCGDQKEWKYQQNGHYMSRGHYPTRWDETNCHVQCAACNVFKKGNYTEYALYMIDRYGANHLEALKRKANSGEKIPTPVIREMIEEYRKKVL